MFISLIQFGVRKPENRQQSHAFEVRGNISLERNQRAATAHGGLAGDVPAGRMTFSSLGVRRPRVARSLGASAHLGPIRLRGDGCLSSPSTLFKAFSLKAPGTLLLLCTSD